MKENWGTPGKDVPVWGVWGEPGLRMSGGGHWRKLSSGIDV